MIGNAYIPAGNTIRSEVEFVVFAALVLFPAVHSGHDGMNLGPILPPDIARILSKALDPYFIDANFTAFFRACRRFLKTKTDS